MPHVAHDAAAIMSGDDGEHSISNGSSGENCREEFPQLVLKGSCCQQKYRSGPGRRRHSRNKDGAESPSLQRILHLMRATLSEFALQPSESGALAKVVRYVRANHGAECRHARVVKPEIGMTRGKNRRENVEAAESGNQRAVQDCERH